MENTTRSNFSKKDIRILYERVGGKCSNPNCRKLTIGPNENERKGSLIGQAAHIYGALPMSGPRHNSSLFDSERKHISNAIWLCNNCARLIDVDEEHYPPQLLQKWKADAEYETRLELEGKMHSQNIQEDRISTGLRTLNIIINKLHEIYVYSVKYAKANFDCSSKYTIQNNIDDYSQLHRKALIYINDFQNYLKDLNEVYNEYSLDFSSKLNKKIVAYKECFCFSFTDDGGIGIANDFWGSLFYHYLNNYGSFSKIFDDITSAIKNEYCK